MSGGFDDYFDALRGQLVRCADEAAPRRAGTSRDGATGAERKRLVAWPAPRRALAWAAVLSLGVTALAAGFLMVGGRSAGPASTSGLLSTPGGQTLPAYVEPVVPGIPASPSAGTHQTATQPGYSLAAIDALSSTDIWSVGARGDTGATGTLAAVQDHSFVVHFDGTVWRETIVPDVGPLTAVAATADGEAWALGPAGAILHWDGLQWKVAATSAQNGGAVLRGLAALAPNNVWAVGSKQGAPFATQWNGVSWQAVSLPATSGGSLNAISGTATDLWVVGAAADATHVLTLHYDGTDWSSVPDAGVSDGGLLTVATIGPDDVWAGGDALLQHFDGTQWRDVSQTFGGVHESLTAVSSSNVWLGGAGGVARWDGAAWRPVTAQQMGLSENAGAQFTAVTALSATDVWAAGTLGTNGATSAPLIVHWDGSAWRPVIDAVRSR